MSRIFEYQEFDADVLVTNFRKFGGVVLRLEKKPALIVLKLAKIYGSISPKSTDPFTTSSNIANIFRLLWLGFVIRFFYKNLQEINKFFYASMPASLMESRDNQFFVLTFTDNDVEQEKSESPGS